MERKQSKNERIEAVIELLRASPQGLLKSEIAYYLDLNRSTVSRYLVALEEQGIYLWEDGRRRLGIFSDKAFKQTPVSELNTAIFKLEILLSSQVNEEAKYQELFQEHPLILGAYYEEIRRHQKLDDENVPDFVGVRVHDQFMDIFEIKPPFMQIFRSDGKFSSDFNKSWNQAERYLAFAQIERDYLQRKGLNFDNPKCILIAGFDLPDEILRRLRTKQRLNPLIQLLTYNDIISIAKALVDRFRLS
jgi:predicted transcriptional regulator